MSLPPSEIPQGAIRFNTDSQRLEFYAQGEWWVMSTDTPNLAETGDTTPGARGLMGGGQGGSPATTQTRIDAINISSTGDGINFGDLSDARYGAAAGSDKTIAIWGGGSTNNDRIDKVTFGSGGTATDFGDLSQGRRGASACSSATRSVFAGGVASPEPTFVSTMDYITTQTGGTAQGWTDSLGGTLSNTSACASPTRGIFAGGNASPSLTNRIEFITIATLGNVQDFGDLLDPSQDNIACSNAVRGVMGGSLTPTTLNTIQYVTLSTTGNSQEFGDLTRTLQHGNAASSPTRAVWMGGVTVNTMDYVQIMTTGDAVDFGDLSLARWAGNSGISNAHGGL